MSGIGGFRGVSASQDARFVNKQKRMLRTKKFPKELDASVDYSRVFWPVIREWTAKRVTELLGVEDEVLIHFIHNRLENTKELNPKELYLDLMPFLEKNAGLFMKELWTLLASASESTTGIPQQIMDAKAEEMKQTKERQALYLQTIEQERKKVIAIQEEAKQAAKKPEGEEKIPEEEKQEIEVQRELHESRQREVKERPRRDHPRRFSSPHRRENISHHRRRRETNFSRDRARSPRDFHPRRLVDSDRRRGRRERRRSSRSSSKTRSLSRSPPDSRHGSLPPRSSNLPLARKREPHDEKSRSPKRHHRRGVAEDTPTTKSPSPRSRNRMSSTPRQRERTPSPPSHKSSAKTPTPKPPTPSTRTPPTRPEEVPTRRMDPPRRSHGRRQGEGSHGGVRSLRSYRLESPSSYRYNATQVRRGYEDRSHRKDYASSRYLEYRSHRHHSIERRSHDRSRRPYAYRPPSPLRPQPQEGRRRKRRSLSSSSFDEVDMSKRSSSSESADSKREERRRRSEKRDKHHREKKRRKHDYRKRKTLHRHESMTGSGVDDRSLSEDSKDESETKEKMKKKLSEILEKKDSLRLE